MRRGDLADGADHRRSGVQRRRILPCAAASARLEAPSADSAPPGATIFDVLQGIGATLADRQRPRPGIAASRAMIVRMNAPVLAGGLRRSTDILTVLTPEPAGIPVLGLAAPASSL